MAKKNLNGQLSMFDFFRNLENDIPLDGEVEMVSLMPDDIAVDEEKHTQKVAESPQETKSEKIVESLKVTESEKSAESLKETKSEKRAESLKATEPEKAAEPLNGDIAMKYEVETSDGNIRDAVYYVNYNTVVIIEDGIKKKLEFDNSKEAVDCYIEYVLRKKKSK